MKLVLVSLFALSGCAQTQVRDICTEQPAVIDVFSKAYDEHRMTEQQGIEYLDLMYVLEAQCSSTPRSAEQQRIIDEAAARLETLAKEISE